MSSLDTGLCHAARSDVTGFREFIEPYCIIRNFFTADDAAQTIEKNVGSGCLARPPASRALTTAFDLQWDAWIGLLWPKDPILQKTEFAPDGACRKYLTSGRVAENASYISPEVYMAALVLSPRAI